MVAYESNCVGDGAVPRGDLFAFAYSVSRSWIQISWPPTPTTSVRKTAQKHLSDLQIVNTLVFQSSAGLTLPIDFLIIWRHSCSHGNETLRYQWRQFLHSHNVCAMKSMSGGILSLSFIFKYWTIWRQFQSDHPVWWANTPTYSMCIIFIVCQHLSCK